MKEPEKFGNSLYTKFKIQWSLTDSFAEVAGEVEVKTVHTLEYNIEQLVEGRRYFSCKDGHGMMVRPRIVSVHGISAQDLLKPESEYPI